MHKYGITIPLLLFIGCTPSKEQSSLENVADSSHAASPQAQHFPKDLMHNGKPIHPCQVILTQFGDSSHFEPKAVEPSLDECMHELTYEYPFVSENYIDDGYDECTSYTYQYVGSYNNNHIILISETGCGSTDWLFLGSIKREGNTIVHVDEIDGADRPGIIRIISYDNKILRYSKMRTVVGVIYDFTNTVIDRRSSHIGYSGISCICEVDFNIPRPDPKVIGLLLEHDEYDFCDKNNPFCATVNQYFECNKKQLNFEEATLFVQDVIQYINNEYDPDYESCMDQLFNAANNN